MPIIKLKSLRWPPAAAWSATPTIVKNALIVGAGLYVAAELSGAVNRWWPSAATNSEESSQRGHVVTNGTPETGATALTQVTGLGVENARKIAEAHAQFADPADTARARQAGKPVTGADATLAAQVKALDADAAQKTAMADAANESEHDILAKMKAGMPVTTTEELKLAELQLKRAEAARQEADAQIAAARAGYANGFYRSVEQMKQQRRPGIQIEDALQALQH